MIIKFDGRSLPTTELVEFIRGTAIKYRKMQKRRNRIETNEVDPVKFTNKLAELLARIKSVQEYALFADAALALNSQLLL